jgi:hypothetical protein
MKRQLVFVNLVALKEILTFESVFLSCNILVMNGLINFFRLEGLQGRIIVRKFKCDE